MGPLPKKRHSRSRRNKRRAHDSVSLNHLVVCDNCGNYHVAHRICPKCGSYRGETRVAVEGDN